MDSPKDPENEKWTSRFGQAIRWAIGIWAGGAIAVFLFGSSLGIDKVGQFGDSLGVINTLFSGLAFATLVITMLMQREELKLQRKEMAETRSVMEGQRDQMGEQHRVSAEAALLGSLPMVIQQLTSSYRSIYGDTLHTENPVSSTVARRLAEDIDKRIVHYVGQSIPGEPDFEANSQKIEKLTKRSDMLRTIAQRYEEMDSLYVRLQERTKSLLDSKSATR